MNSPFRRARRASPYAGAGIRARNPFAMARIGKWDFKLPKPRRRLRLRSQLKQNRRKQREQRKTFTLLSLLPPVLFLVRLKSQLIVAFLSGSSTDHL